MSPRFQRPAFSAVFLLTILFCGCMGSRPILSPTEEFLPDKQNWEKTLAPAGLLGDWYYNGKLNLSLTVDTLRVQGIWTLIESVERANSFFRVVYRVEQIYKTIYIHALNKAEIEVAYTEGTASNSAQAESLPLIKIWYPMTSTNPWIAAVLPSGLQGTWHIEDGLQETDIQQTQVVLDGTSWNIEAVETNRTVDRLVLKNGENRNWLYYKNIGTYQADVLLLNNPEDPQDRFGNVPGAWIKLYRWWDLIQTLHLNAGSRLEFNFTRNDYNRQEHQATLPAVDSLYENNLAGRLELEVTGSTITCCSGSLTLRAAFQIDLSKERLYYALKDSLTTVLKDSSWSNTAHDLTEDHEITLENDSLWLITGQGKVLFACRKLRPAKEYYWMAGLVDVVINLRPFLYPVSFQSEIFPNGLDIKAIVRFVDQTGAAYSIFQHSSATIVLFGEIEDGNAVVDPRDGLELIEYWYGDYNPPSQSLDPYTKVSKFSCKVVK